MNKGKLIIINGASGSGKTSTCRAIQDILDELFVLLGIDCFTQITPPKQNNIAAVEPTYLATEKYPQNGEDYFNITTGPVLNDVIFTSYKAISTYLEEGINVISDQLFWSYDWFRDALHIFKPYNVFFVGLHVSEAEGIKREQQRISLTTNEKVNGWHRTSAEITHKNMIYDFEIDSSNLSISDTAKKIIDAYKNTPSPSAFKVLAEKIL